MATVEKWILYSRHVQQRRQREIEKYTAKWGEPPKEKQIPEIDKVDDYDKHYNAVHNAVIMNNLQMLNILHDGEAGSLIIILWMSL